MEGRSRGVLTLLVAMTGVCDALQAQRAPVSAPGQPAPATHISDRFCRDTLAGMRAPAPGSEPALTWHDGLVPWAEWKAQLGASRVPITVVVARIDPSRVALALDIVREGDALGDALGAWSIARAPDTAVVAFNAGQFTDAGPWGWVVHRGREWQAPGTGTLAATIVVDTGGRVHITSAPLAARWQRREGRAMVVEAIQSYPHLLQAARLPAALCRAGGINRAHRDIRLAMGLRRDGQVLVALTRYAPPALLPEAAARLPIGPTTLEMAEIMHRLGAVDAVMLDGGLSAQLRIGARGAARDWPGLRAVPLAFVGNPRPRPGSPD